MNVFYPVLALIGWTMICYFRMGLSRFGAVKRGEVDPRHYTLYQEGSEPEHLRKQTRHVRNLLEAPLLFYVVCLVAYQTGQVGTLVAGLAWTYAILRFVHSAIHLGGNVVLNRFKVFGLSMIVLTALWVYVLAGIIQNQ